MAQEGRLRRTRLVREVERPRTRPSVHRETVGRTARLQESKPANPIAGPASAATAHQQHIEKAVEKGLSAQRIWQDLDPSPPRLAATIRKRCTAGTSHCRASRRARKEGRVMTGTAPDRVIRPFANYFSARDVRH
jgi:hypothetical protein